MLTNLPVNQNKALVGAFSVIAKSLWTFVCEAQQGEGLYDAHHGAESRGERGEEAEHQTDGEAATHYREEGSQSEEDIPGGHLH